MWRLVFCMVAGVALLSWGALPGLAEPTASRPVIHDISSESELQAAFDAHADQPRLVLFLGPTCDGCMAGARWVKEKVLAAHPQMNLAVIAVWLPVEDEDSRQAADVMSLILKDGRVTHLWDPSRAASTWLHQAVVAKTTGWKDKEGFESGYVFDSFFAYPPHAALDKPAAFGTTIMENHQAVENFISNQGAGQSVLRRAVPCRG